MGFFRKTYVPKHRDNVPVDSNRARPTFGPWADHDRNCKCSACR